MAHYSKKYVGSVEVFKYPYCGTRIESKEFLSEKICCYTIKVRQKIIKKTKLLIVYGDLILRLTSLTHGIVPSQAIGLWILPTNPTIIRSINSEASFYEKRAIAPVIDPRPDQIVFSEKQMDKLYEIALKCMNNFMNQEEIIAELRGGDIRDYVAAIGVIMTFIVMLTNISTVEAFPVRPGAIPPPHFSWLYGNSKPDHHSGFGKKAGPRSLIVADATRNAGSEKNQPSHGSLDYKEIMRELDRQSTKKKIEISVGDTRYILKNIPGDTALELSEQLGNQIYESIRKCDTDISDIAKNLGCKSETVKKIKDYVFFNQHFLAKEEEKEGEPLEYRRFDPNLQQALAWKRLETGTHTQEDITWMKHEDREGFVESLNNLTYSDAHRRAQQHFDGAPWDNNY